MNIYILNPMAFDGIGPSQTCIKIAEAMCRAGHDVVIFGTRRKIDTDPKIKFYAPFANIGKNIPFRYTKSLLNAWLNKAIVRQVPDGAIVYAWPSTEYATLEKLKEKNCKIFYETINIHTITEKNIIEREMTAEDFFYDHYVTKEKINNQVRSHALADYIFVSNEFALQSVIDAGVSRQNIVLTRYGSDPSEADLDVEETSPGQSRRFVFVFVGRINMEKGVHKLLRAWKSANVDAELHLYGSADNKMVEKYQSLFEQERVRLMGFTNDIHKVYASSNAFIFLSHAEGGPLVSIEAAFHKLPMIVSAEGGGRIAKDQETALVVDPNDTKAVAHAIEKIFNDKSLREKLTKAAYQIASREFTWKKAAEERLSSMQT